MIFGLNEHEIRKVSFSLFFSDDIAIEVFCFVFGWKLKTNFISINWQSFGLIYLLDWIKENSVYHFVTYYTIKLQIQKVLGLS